MKRALGWLITVPLWAACASTSSVPVAQPIDSATRSASLPRLFPLPSEALTIPFEGESGKQSKSRTLDALLSDMERITPVRFVVDSQTRTLLGRTPAGNMQTIVVPPERIWTVFEAILIENDFCLGVVSTQDPIMFSVISTQPQAGRGQGGPRARAIFVPVGDLPAWIAHPAFVITTTVALDDVNIRDLSNSMRQMFIDPQTQQIIPIGNSNSLMITGFGAPVASLVRILQAINESERTRHEMEDKLSAEDQVKRAERTGVAPPK